MYLSKIILDIRHPSVRQALWDVNDMHRNLMAGFDMRQGLEAPRAENHMLYRLFTGRDQVFVLMISRDRPDAAQLARRGFHTEEALIRDISDLEKSFVPGRYLRFELLASPCKKVGGSSKNSRRVFLPTWEERMAWLNRKAEQCGFKVVQADEQAERVEATGRRGDMPITHVGVVFSGVLCITDAAAFWKGYTCGIGPGKAYGLGMLNVSKL